MQKKKQKKTLFFKYLIYGMLGLAVILFMTLSEKARAAFIVSLFIFGNMVITSYKKFINIPIEVEILTMGIVLTTVNYGIQAGLVVAILGGILGFFVGLEFSPFAFPMFFGYILMVFVSFFLRNFNLTFVGITTALINNLLIFSLYHFIFGYDLSKNLRFSLSNIILNIILFLNIAPLISALMV